MLESVIAGKNKYVVDTRHKFARKRYAREYLWQPSPKTGDAIRKAIFGRLEPGGNRDWLSKGAKSSGDEVEFGSRSET